jgi:tricorn protease
MLLDTRLVGRGVALLLLGWVTGLGQLAAEPSFERPPAGMLRFPAIGPEYIAFSYATQLWIVPREGGEARAVAFPEASVVTPAFSPDGSQLAFVTNFDGQRDIFVMPTEGGVPRRVTTHPGDKRLSGWTPDGTHLVYSTSFFTGQNRAPELYKVPATGGQPVKLPVPYGENASFSADGRRMAYMPHARDLATWKRYAGGQAPHIWIFDLETFASQQITHWEGTDTFPMWHGDAIYYLSDEDPPWRLNIWRFDVATGERERLTHFAEHDVRFPSLGPGPDGAGEIVFQLGQQLRVLDLGTREVRTVDVRIRGALPIIRPQWKDASEAIQARAISPTGARVLLEARGDIWTLPARRGSARNLTRTSGIAERQPAWSPDGRYILYSSDASGEYELTVRRADGSGEPRAVTEGSETYYYTPVWAPDSRQFVVLDKSQRLWHGKVPGQDEAPTELRELAFEPGWPFMSLAWSPDSRWVVFSRSEDDGRFLRPTNALWAVEVESGEKIRLTSGMFSATDPAFDEKGEYLAFVSFMDFTDPRYEDIGTTFIYDRTARLVIVPLREDGKSPLLPKSDEESVEEAKKKEEEEKDGDGDGNGNGDNENGEENGEDGAPARPEEGEEDEEEEGEGRMEFAWEGFESRAVLLPVERGNISGVRFNDQRRLVYLRRSTNRWSSSGTLHIFDPFADEPKEETILENVNSFILSADRKKILAMRGDAMAVINAASGQRWEHPVSTSTMRVLVDPRAEWRQILRDVWRRHRDFFYVENMHGVNWEQVWEDYSALLPYLSSRADLNFVIGEMIAELNAGHAYVWGGLPEETPRVAIGTLGADFFFTEVDGLEGYRIERIHTGAPWDLDARGPLSQPGIRVDEGDFLLAVNGFPLDRRVDPWIALTGLANQVVTLRIGPTPDPDHEDARDVVVRTLASDQNLRFRSWVEGNRRKVEKLSDGRVGYIFVPDTAVNGQNELFRQYYGQLGMEAIVIDERWNGGGQVPHRFIELLNRPRQTFWARRDGKDWATPADGFNGPLAMLVNGASGSGGDAFPHFFREAGLGPVIGTRTWGGLIGITTVPSLIDGGHTAVPTFGIYNEEGRWIIEGYGVRPDIEVIDDPALMVDGGDPQIEAAVRYLLDELERNPRRPPNRPEAPDRSGFGIDPAHR